MKIKFTNQNVVNGGFEYWNKQDSEWITDGNIGYSVTADTDHVKQGNQSIKLHAHKITGATSTTNAGKYIHTDFSGVTTFSFWVYISDKTLLNCVQLFLTSTLDWSKYFIYGCDAIDLVNGWNYLTFVQGDFGVVGGENWANTMVQTKIRVVTLVNGTCDASFDDWQLDGVLYEGFENLYTYLPSFWHSTDEDIWKRINTMVFSGSFCLGAYASGSITKNIYSTPFFIENPPTNLYTFHAAYRFEDNDGEVTFILTQLDSNMGVLASTTLFQTGNPVNWTKNTKTIGGIGSGADFELNANTIYVEIRATFSMIPSGSSCMAYIDDARLEGNTNCELNVGNSLPYIRRTIPLQEVNEALGGTFYCDDTGKDINVFEFNFQNMREDDKNRLLTFFNHNDVKWQHNSFRFREFNGRYYDVWFVTDSIGLREMPPGIYNNISFTLREY